jgi:Rod binding domain-containing protein
MPGPIQMPMGSMELRAGMVRSGTTAQTGGHRTEKLEQVCKDFESIFVDFMLQQMRQTVPQSEMFGGGRAEQLYTSMLDSELAKSISNQRGLGLASELHRQLMAVSAGKGNEDPKKD